MDDERLTGEPATARCRSCGNDATQTPEGQAERDPRPTYQVIVSCADCGNAFAAIARN